MKIFWSWQSDTPGKIGRHFVRDALMEAIATLKQPDEIEEPTQAENRESMHLDQDRQDVTGSPPLVNTIKQKIRNTAVFLGDVTPVSTIPKRKSVAGSKQKRNMNPNVAIELGYAQHAICDERILLVLNEFYGGRQFLPFDLQHHAGPIIYSLAPEASKEDIAAERAKLRGQFVGALRGFLKDGPAEQPVAFNAVPSTTSRAAWFQPGAVLASLDEKTHFGFADDKGVYLRLAPRLPLHEPLSTTELYGRARQMQMGLLYREQASIPYYNDDGAIVLEGSPAGGALRAASQAFHNGEIWGIGRTLLVDNEHGRLIPMRLIERVFDRALTGYVEFLAGLGVVPPFRVEYGAVGVKGYSLAIDSNVDNPYRTYDDAFSDSFILQDATVAAIDAAVLRISQRFFRASGYDRPVDFPQHSGR
jgi:hypothetical protein